MSDTILFALRELTLAVLIGSLAWRVWVMNANTSEWNGLGRWFRRENFVYIAVWSWAALNFLDWLRHPAIIVVLSLALIVVTVGVTRLLPDVQIRHPDEERMVTKVEKAAARTEEAAERIEHVAEDLDKDGTP